MANITKSLDIVSTVDGDDKLVFVKLDLVKDGEHLITLEFADITTEFKDLEEINTGIDIYENILDLKLDIANAHLLKFLKKDRSNYKLDLLLNLRMKMLHQNGICKENCILCNPDIGDDPFPDFTFIAKHSDPEGEA